MADSTKPRSRAGAAQLSRPDIPYTMRLADGRTVYVEIPGRWTETDRSGQVVFLPSAIHFLDQLRALSMRLDRPPSPLYIKTLREALGMTQVRLAEALRVNKLTVSRRERGVLRPSGAALRGLERLRQQRTRRGVVLAG